jgi:Tfp pilus assembly protein PilO
MSKEITITQTNATTGFRSRIDTYVASRRSGMFGLAEIAALAGSCLILALVLFSYLYFMIPARSRITSLTAERAQLQTNIQKTEQIFNEEEDTQKKVQRITGSLNDFETAGLQHPEQGRMALYDQLNQLMVKNGLRNTSGPTYAPLEPTGAKQSPGKSTNTKWQTAYPGIAVAVTVEGQYQNIRHFIKDIERSRQFVVINEVELQRATQSDGAATSANPESGTGTRVSLVSLQLSMAAYFQRSEALPAPSQDQ